MLTNGINWEIHRVDCDGKVQSKKLLAFDFLELNPKNGDHQQMLFLLCKRGVAKDVITEFYEYRQSVNRYTVGAVLLTEPVINIIRREVRKIKAGLKVGADEIKEMIADEVIKRDLIESDEAKKRIKQVAKATKQREKSKIKMETESDPVLVVDNEQS